MEPNEKNDNQLEQVNPQLPSNQNPRPEGNNGQPMNSAPKGPNIFRVLVIGFLLTFVVNALMFSNVSTGYEIEYSAFIQLVESGNVKRAVIGEESIQLELVDKANLDTIEKILYPEGRIERQRAPRADDVYITMKVEDASLVERLNANNVSFYTPYVRSSPILEFILSWIVPLLLIYLFYSFLMKKLVGKMGQGGGMGGMFGGVGKSKAKEYNLEKTIGVRFSDVAGQDEAKESMTELVDYLHDPGKYQEIGAKQPKGALLVGPPGTGKTLLAKALAGEAKVPFYSISGSEFVEMFVGVGASRVRDLFSEAKKTAPCIIFIDEIDAIGKSRDNRMGSNDEQEQTLNQLLAEMDGFDSEKGIIVLAATNRPEILDKALLRPGRFDRRIIVEKPDLPGREAILKVHAAKVKMDESVNLREIALATSGATGADLANMVNEGALLAVKEGRKTVRQQDLMEAVEVVIAGKEKKDRVMNVKERRMVAYHEVGHALVSALQTHSQPVQKITIVPRTMGSLGYTMNMPEEERYLMTKDEMLAEISTLLGGRAAEIVTFGTMTTGASNDIERATAMARGMVAQYGMSDSFGPMGLESIQNRYLDGRAVSNCSPETETKIDEEVRGILLSCQEKAIALLKANTAILDEISKYLLEKENITGEEFMRFLPEKSN